MPDRKKSDAKGLMGLTEKELQSYIEFMARNDLQEFELEEGGMRIVLRRPGSGGVIPVITAATAPVAAESRATPTTREDDPDLAKIVAPFAGTFYRSASPETPVFTDVGKKVNPDTTVCILEAMKTMNEIKAELTGTIQKICKENGSSVALGDVLFLVQK